MQPEDLINKAQNSATVGFHKFVLLHTRFGTDLFCFFEGKDTQYYFPRIDHNYGNDHHPIVCGNKKSVIETSKLVQSRYKQYKTAFFVDSDFDGEIYEGIYSTPCYSIENLYCTKNVLSNILKHEFRLSVLDHEYKIIMEIFEKNQEDFHSAVMLFNMWYAAAKKKASKNNTIVNVSLNDKFPKDFVTIKIGHISCDYSLQKIYEKYPEAILITEEEIEEYLKDFDIENPTLKFRGKYEIEFFYTFLRFLIEDANKSKRILKNKTKFNVDSSQIISQLSQYSETPECLIHYICQFKNIA